MLIPVQLRSCLFCAVIVLFGSGCVHRRMTIHSDPPGAMVMLDGESIGYTPVSRDFTYYGTRELTLIKDGYETMTVNQEIRTPWYQWYPLDIITDNFLPQKLRDRRSFSYQLKRRSPYESTQNLIERGKSLRSEAQLGL